MPEFLPEVLELLTRQHVSTYLDDDDDEGLGGDECQTTMLSSTQELEKSRTVRTMAARREKSS